MNNSNHIKRFIILGRGGDESDRRELCRQVHEILVSGEGKVFVLSEEYPVLIDKLNSILIDEELKSFCKGRKDLSEHITEELISFVTEGSIVYDKGDSILEEELERLQAFKTTGFQQLAKKIKSLCDMFSERYTEQEIDLTFYIAQLKLIEGLSSKENKQIPLGKLKNHLENTWETHLMSRILAYRSRQIDLLRQKYLEELHRKINEFKRLENFLEAIIGNVGQLWDLSKGHLSRMNFQQLEYYAHQLEQDKSIQELTEILGRMQHAQTKMEQKQVQESQIVHLWHIDTASKSDLVGVQESDDINALLPTEIVLLADPELELNFYKKYTEKKLQTFEYQARILKAEEAKIQTSKQDRVEESKGPFIICIDTSGSMRGTPESVAKALCLAILKIALRDERHCFLISFSTQINTIELSNITTSITQLLDFLSMSFYGGTDVSSALVEALVQLENGSYSNADVIVVSDFIMPQVSESTAQGIANAKMRGVKFHSLVINQTCNQVGLNLFDNNWFYEPHNEGSVFRLVQSIDSL